MKALSAIDFYKADHRRQYPVGTEYVYSNFTPRSGKHSNVDLGGIVFFGLQGFIKSFLIDCWNETFFNVPKDEILKQYKRRMDTSLGKDSIDVSHIAELHDLGYLPLRIKALPEGSFVPYGVPVLTIVNTDPKFFWLTNYLESVMSAELWKPCTSATTAKAYKNEFIRHARLTGTDLGFTNWQGHDFSFRGMGGVFDSISSGAGHLTSFWGTDTLSAIDYLEDYYNANADNEIVGGSVPATEHSVMCMGTYEDELGTFKRLISELYPKGIVSIVSDTWDFWKVITEYLPELKDTITAREGRVVVRPDSGDPVKIICGDPESNIEHVRKGAYECLFDTFGGTVSCEGYKVLSPSVGLIYGDSITLDRQRDILSILESKGFSASNLVLGIGSYTYTYVTRDTHGFAMKATYGVVREKATNVRKDETGRWIGNFSNTNGELLQSPEEERSIGREIFKDPKTDDGLKKSAKGLLKVNKVDGRYQLEDQVTKDQEDSGELKTVFLDGEVFLEQSLRAIRTLVDN